MTCKYLKKQIELLGNRNLSFKNPDKGKKQTMSRSNKQYGKMISSTYGGGVTGPTETTISPLLSDIGVSSTQPTTETKPQSPPPAQQPHMTEVRFQALDKLLDSERQHNKTESWNKLDNTIKIQRLHAYAEVFGANNHLPAKDVKLLKVYFVECLTKNKLQKAKDVIYSKESQEVVSVPGLGYSASSGPQMFTLRNMDSSRVSTVNSLTPKRFMTEPVATTATSV